MIYRKLYVAVPIPKRCAVDNCNLIIDDWAFIYCEWCNSLDHFGSPADWVVKAETVLQNSLSHWDELWGR